MKSWIKEKWYLLVYIVFLGMTICFCIHTGKSGERYRFFHIEEQTFEQEWTYLFSDGTAGTTELPAQLESGEAEELILKNTLPELPEGVEFIYRSRHTEVEIYVGGELRYASSVQTKNQEEIRDDWFPLSGNIWNEVPLKTDDSRKEIEIRSTGEASNYIKGPGSVYLGERGTFFLKLLQERMGTLTGSILLLLLAVELFVLWLILLFTTRSAYQECLCLSFFTASVGLWELTETRCLQFLFQNMRMWGIFAYEILALAPVPIALYYSYRRRERTVRLSRIAASIALVLWAINNCIHFLGIADISQTLVFTQMLNLFEILFIGYIQISDIVIDVKETKQGHEVKFWWVPLAGLGIFIPLTLIEVLQYALNIGVHHDDALLTNLGMIAYIISLAFTTVLRLVSENIRVREASEAKTQFLANMSHEIRTPLNAVLGFDELILRDCEDKQIREYAAGIQSAGMSLRDIINAILDLTKIESGKMENRREAYSTVGMLDQVSSMIRALAEEKGLYFHTNIDANIPEVLIGDELHIRQILTNLMTNAVKYTKDGGVTFSVSAKQNPDQNGECVLLFSVKDTGIGIREEDRTRLFEKFERLDEEKNRGVEGTGLGMSIVVKLLETMGSRIELKSTYGEGSEFYFFLRQGTAVESVIGNYDQASKRRAEEERDKAAYTAPAAKVLIVDDVALNRQVACGLLAELRMQIDTAESGKEAIELVRRKRYDVIFMDHMMPEMDGIEAVRQIRALFAQTGDLYYAKVPIIALTANALTGMREKFLEAGMQDFVAKPVEGKELHRVLSEWLPDEKKILGESQQCEEEWSVQISGICASDAKKYTPDLKTYQEMLQTFLFSNPMMCENICRYLKEKDRENYTIAVHGLKSASRVIGANEISELAEKLEAESKEEPLSSLEKSTGDLLALCETLEAELRDYFDEPDDKEQKRQLSYQEMQVFLKELREAAENFDMESFIKCGEQMRQIRVEAPYETVWEEIFAAVENLSFSETLEKLELIEDANCV